MQKGIFKKTLLNTAGISAKKRKGIKVTSNKEPAIVRKNNEIKARRKKSPTKNNIEKIAFILASSK